MGKRWWQFSRRGGRDNNNRAGEDGDEDESAVGEQDGGFPLTQVHVRRDSAPGSGRENEREDGDIGMSSLKFGQHHVRDFV